MVSLFRANLGLSITLALLVAGGLVSLLVGILMSRSGASLRPIVWFAGFFLMVVLPQVIGHGYRAWQQARATPPSQYSGTGGPRTAAPLVTLPPPTLGSPAWFGPDADPALIHDVRSVFGPVFAPAQRAQFASFASGESVVIGEFANPTAAAQAWESYLSFTGLKGLLSSGDASRGGLVRRPAGDLLYLLPVGPLLGVWTGPDVPTIRKRMEVGGFTVPSDGPLMNTGTPGLTTTVSSPKPTVPRPVWFPWLVGIGLPLYTLGVVMWYFKGAAWAGSFPAQAGVPPVSATTLSSRLLAINGLDVPIQLEAGANPGEIYATWAYADARWLDLAGAHRLRRVHRVRMALDEGSHCVRATDYQAAFDASAGRGGVKLQWHGSLGIVFFQQERVRIFGLHLDPDGKFRPDPSYAYSFNLQELKGPLQAAVTQAGWTWRPVVWDGPRWLRWLTE
jgi:hypothetical protein